MGDQIQYLIRLRNVQNQRVVLGSALGGKNLLRRFGVETVGAQSVNGLGGKNYQFSPAQKIRRLFDGFGVLCVGDV